MAKIKVRKGNEVLRVEENLASYYLNKGFNVIEEDGTIIRAALPNDIGTLQTAYIEHLAKIKSLEEEVAKLTSELNTKKSTARKKAVEE